MTDKNPARAGVDVEVGWVLMGQGVGDSGVGALVIVMSGRSQEAGPHGCVFTQEVWVGTKGPSVNIGQRRHWQSQEN